MVDSPVTPGDPFSFQLAQHAPLIRAAFVAARPLFSGLLRLGTLRDVYRRSARETGSTFEQRALKSLGITFRVRAAGGGSIPPGGPLIIAANHPTGAVDGLVLAEAVREVRPDVRILANYLLSRIPELHESCYFVDPFGGPAGAARSLEGLRSAHIWLRRGGALVVFPAGEVAWQPAGPAGRVDSAWHESLGRLALASGATVLPAFLDASNSRAFYAAGRIHPALRTLLLGHELLRQRGRTVTVQLGRRIEAGALQQLDAAGATRRARQAFDDLAREGRLETPPAPIGPAVDPDLLGFDVDALPPDAKLLSSGVHDVFCAGAAAIPHVLREIGRLREITFRAVGEGTGEAFDLDRFDESYDHLFVWNRARRQVVGAYRVGRTDRILAAHGRDGLYTSTLFRYDERLMQRISPALELGRSFVRAEYQRSHTALFLLWRGIGRLVARAPEYRVLFGPVSISPRYRDTSQQMLRAYLTLNHGASDLASFVEAVNPPRPVLPPDRGAARAATVDELDSMIRHLEEGPGVPVLLRQYLRLNAALLGFNIDPAFGDALDALMMVDLTRLPTATLRRYLGTDEARAFLERHAKPEATGAAA